MDCGLFKIENVENRFKSVELMGIGNVMAMAISMMTESEFWDKFNRKHNPQFYDKLKKSKTKTKKTTKKKTSRSKSTKRYPIFKVSD
tara:strand:+ start:321 stop:581 length:261 start_codon:yes stop_codon:yes gene_type:complete